MASAQNLRNFYRLYVGNIPWTVSHLELKQYFSKFGFVNQAIVVFDKNTGLSRNYGFVVYGNRDGFEKATNTTVHKLEGNILNVQQASAD